MKQFYFLLTLSIVTFGTNGFAIAQNSSESSNPHQYSEEFVREYATECMQTSMAEGLAEAEAQKLCDCTLNKFQSKYELSEFKQLTIDAASNQNAQAALVEVGQICFEQILYEQ